MARRKSVVLLSGGLDSAANLAFCREQDDPILALTADYGQRAAAREIQAARGICELFGVRHQVVALPWLGALGGSALTDTGRRVPEPADAELDRAEAARETAKSVWVPNRNGVLINVAAAFAEREGAERVVVGFNREEAASFPDNSEEFVERATGALAFSTANGVEVSCYTARLDKREIVSALRRLPREFPFGRIWSCYQGGEEPCGACESCRRFRRALNAE